VCDEPVEVGEEQNDPKRIDDATILELEDVRGVGGGLKTAGDIRIRNGYREKLRKAMPGSLAFSIRPNNQIRSSAKNRLLSSDRHHRAPLVTGSSSMLA